MMEGRASSSLGRYRSGFRNVVGSSATPMVTPLPLVYGHGALSRLRASKYGPGLATYLFGERLRTPEVNVPNKDGSYLWPTGDQARVQSADSARAQ